MKPIEHPKSLMEVTAEQIRGAIISGELPLGAKLSEQRLADTLGVSRSPVRDALAALKTEGLVNIWPKRGTFVFTPDKRSVDEMTEYRAVLETAALRMGLRRNHAKLLQNMEIAIAEMQDALNSSDGQSYAVGDMQFHKAIVDSCENRSVIKAYDYAMSPMKALRTHMFTIMDEHTTISLREHIDLTNACRENDANLAASKLEAHIGNLAKSFHKKTSASDQSERLESAG